MAQLEWPNQFVLMYHGVICLYNRANYERFAFATSDGRQARVPRSVPRSLFRSSPVSSARLLSDDPADVAALFTLTRITITLRPLTHSAPMSRRNVDNDDATVIRRTADCCRTVQPEPDRSSAIRGSSGESALPSRKWTSSETRLTTSVSARAQVTTWPIWSWFKSEIPVMRVIRYGSEHPQFPRTHIHNYFPFMMIE